MATINKMGFKKYWAAKKANYQAVIDAGLCHIRYMHTGRIHVIAPSGQYFTEQAYKIGGRYRKRTRIWTFPTYKSAHVVELCDRVFPGKVKIIPYRHKKHEAGPSTDQGDSTCD